MSNPEKLSHWKSLAALLGTEPPPESEASEASPQAASPASAPPTPPVPPVPPAPKKPSPPKAPPQRRESNWGKLANILGLSSPPPSPEPGPQKEQSEESGRPEGEIGSGDLRIEHGMGVERPAEDVRAVQERQSPRQRQFTPERNVPPERHAPRRSSSRDSEAAELVASHWRTPEPEEAGSVDPLEMTSEPFIEETIDAIDIEVIEELGPSDEQAASERPRRRRRRGRGRGRGRRQDGQRTAPSNSKAAEFDSGSSNASFDTPAVPADSDQDAELFGDESDDDVRREDETTIDAERDTGPSDKAGDEGRDPRRRRRRRGRGRRGRRDESSAASADQPRRRDDSRSPTTSPSRVRHDLDDVDADDEELMEVMDQDHDDDSDGDDDKGGDLQLSHKKIPSWQEAIESVITTNMTSRANNPSSGSRGGRGRGRRDR